jgi:hypothetical protein
LFSHFFGLTEIAQPGIINEISLKGFIVNKGIIIVCLVSIILSGCDGTDGADGGASSRNVLRDEATILDSVLAISVAEDRPDGITTTFFAELDDQIYLWVLWTHVRGRHVVEVNWFSPDEAEDDPPFRTDKEVFTSETGDQITWFFIESPDDGFSTGSWSVEILLDELFERRHLFSVD